MAAHTSTRVPEVIDHLVSTFTAAVTGDPESVLVVDGPAGTNLNNGRPLLLVGSRGLDEDDQDAVTSSQDWRYTGSRRRTETVTVVCSLWVTGGETDMAARRERAYTLLDLLAESLRSSMDALSVAGRVTELGITEVGHRSTQSSRGAEIALTFTVTANAIV